MGEVDLSWTREKEPWDRLRWARARAKFKSARAFALRIGMKEHTYRAYETPPGGKHTELTHERALEFGKVLKVRADWLAYGSGEPWIDPAREADPNLEELIDRYRRSEPDGQRLLLETSRLLRPRKQA